MRPQRNSPEKIIFLGKLKAWVFLPIALLFLAVTVSFLADRDLGPGFIGLLLGLPLAWVGLRGLQQVRLGRAYPQYYDALMRAPELTLPALSGELHKRPEALRQDLHHMARLKLIPPLRMDKEGRVHFIDTTGQHTSYTRSAPDSYPVICAGCGATGTSVAGQHNRCQYCGNTLNPPWAR